jgi:hypothetical protein
MIRMPSILSIYLLKLNRLVYKSAPRLPTCYLLSSKFILTIMLSITIYFFTMDIMLLFKIKNRHLMNAHYYNGKNSIDYSSPLLPTTLNSEHEFVNRQDVIPTNGVFWPLPVKKIMMVESTHYMRSPVAEFIETNLHFSEIFPFISANIISITHCILSVVSTKFLCSNSLFKRQFGVCIFQFRNFLDSFDGVIYRAHANKRIYKSHYGSIGYFIDAVSDVFGGLCLMLAIGYYLFKNPPPNKNRTKCFRLAEDIETSLRDSSSSSSSYIYHKLSNGSNGSNNSISSSNCSDVESQSENSLFASKTVVFISVALCAIRLGISALFWDRSVHAYEDLLDCVAKNKLHQVLCDY